MKRVVLLCLTLMCAIVLAAPAFAEPRSVNGMAVSEDPGHGDAGEMSTELAPLGGPPPSGVGYTGVDDLDPCFFLNTFPMMKTWYKPYGVQFKGPSQTDGAAVLGECGGWAITGFTGPNILAFNCLATMANGGQPIGPETLIFSPAVDAVQFSIGSGADVGFLVRVEARNADGGLVDSANVTLTAAMQNVFLMGNKKIKKVVIGGGTTNACIYAVDNIYWGTP